MKVMTKRNESIDFIKGIAIFSVVLAHCWLVGREIFYFIYSFHMPLFFCISGYLFSAKKKYIDFLVGKIKNLIVPYVLFFAFSFFVTVVIFQKDITILEGLKNMILGGKSCVRVNNWALWYLQLFFIASNIFYFIAKIKYTIIRIAILIGLFAISLPVQQWCNNNFYDGYVPFALNALCPALFFMLVAFEFKRIKAFLQEKFSNKNTSVLVTIVSFALFLLGILLAAGNTDQIISLKSYTFLIYSLLILQFVVLICQNCSNKYIVYMGKNSLIILGLHRILLHICSNILPVKAVMEYFHMTNLAGAIIVSCLCIFVICALNYTIESIAKKIKNKN